MQEQFNVSHKGQELGPFTKDEILAKVRAGELSALDFVFLLDKKDWIPMVEFLPTTATPPPTIPREPTVTTAQNLPIKAPPKSPPKPPPTSEAKRGTVSLKNGIGTIELLQYTAGTIKLAILPDGKHGLDLKGPQELVVKAAKATKLVLKGPGEVVAGQAAQVQIEAHDKWGNRDSSLAATVHAQLSTGADLGEISIVEGRGTLSLKLTKAETVLVKIIDSTKMGLDVSSGCEVRVVAGPPTQLILATPEETIAGQAVKVHVKALDQFGNLATNCNENVLLEVTAALKAAAEAAKKAS